MPVTQADIDALNAALASGEKQVALGAQQVTYRSVAELKTARDLLQAELDKQSGVTKSRLLYATHGGRGY